MHSLSYLYTFFSQVLYITCFKDTIEVLFFTVLVYYLSLWLQRDTQKNLLYLFFSYYAVTVGSYYCSLDTVSTALIACTPLAIILFIILHQETLQKNFVMLKKVHKKRTPEFHWIDELMKILLNAINSNREIVGVIERSDNLNDIIDAPYTLYADIQKEAFDILSEKQSHTKNGLLWLNQEGKLIAFNARWRLELCEEWISYDVITLPKWKQDAIFITSKTDALIFKINPLSRTFDLIVQGKLIEKNDAQQTLLLLYAYLAPKNNTKIPPTTDYTQSHKSSLKQGNI
jgi:DNA integrity scanning protein DisA with diadenylate cyclase activity